MVFREREREVFKREREELKKRKNERMKERGKPGHEVKVCNLKPHLMGELQNPIQTKAL